MVFGTAGVPLSCPKRDSLEGIKFVKKLGLGAFEFEFVHSALMAPEKAAVCGNAAKGLGVTLSAHAPYYINLCSEDKDIIAARRRRIMDTMSIMQNAGGGRVVIHSGFFGRLERKKTYELVKGEFETIIGECKNENIDLAVLAPETTGKPSAFGSLEELYGLSADIGFKKIRPTIDFGHLHARSNGGIKSKGDYERIFDDVEETVGKAGTQNLHCHFTGIIFSERGELKHTAICSNSPRFGWLAQVLAERKCSGVIISESPNIEGDALLMKRIYGAAVG